MITTGFPPSAEKHITAARSMSCDNISTGFGKALFSEKHFRRSMNIGFSFMTEIPSTQAELDEQIRSMGLVVVKIPARAPKANALCERLIGTIRRECLDLVIPFGEKHVRRILSGYIRHYNESRPHSSLGPGIPDGVRPVPISSDYSIVLGSIVRSRKVLGGLRHEYWLENIAA
jgi:hypothetical protein